VRRAFVVAAILCLAGCGGSTAAATVHSSPSPALGGHIAVGGVPRTYVAFKPPYLSAAQAAPLVIALHGYTVDAGWMESTTRYDELAKTAGFVVVYPQGIGNSWNAGACCGQNNYDDVAFMRALITHLMSSANIDPKRVFVAGMSNGGMMAQRLACELSDRITAVASVSGSLMTDSCHPSRAISVMEMHGTADSIVPYNGGPKGGLGKIPPTLSVMKQWAGLDGCAPTPVMTQSGIMTTSQWTGCRDGSSVVLDAIVGENHTWFNAQSMQGEPEATQVTWDFFSHAPPLL